MDNVIDLATIQEKHASKQEMEYLGTAHFYRDADGVMTVYWELIGSQDAGEVLQEAAWVASDELGAILYLKKDGMTSIRCLPGFGPSDYWWVTKNVLALCRSMMPGGGDY